MNKLKFFAPFLLALAGVFIMNGSAHAYSQTRLMDDQVFDNVNSLNATQVADFLAARSGPFTKLASPSPCLASYSNINFHWDNVKWHYGSDADWNTAWGPAQISAADIITKAAQMWGINPQVLIATLQKEESLITGTNCDPWRYNSAMGYGCPDSGGCNPKYVGFTKQVLWGAWQLKFNKERSYGNTVWDGDDVITYVGYMTQGTRKRCGTCTANYYDGYATLDGQSVYLENGTTASLYTYTPHLGNSTPVNFERWFGPAVLPTYAWQVVSQTYGRGTNQITTTDKETLTVVAKNTGSATWSNTGPNLIRMGTTAPTDRTSGFYDASWPARTRPAVLQEGSVAPGDNGTFSFTIQAPDPGLYQERFNLVSEGVTWFNDPGLSIGFNVTSPPASVQPLVPLVKSDGKIEVFGVNTKARATAANIYHVTRDISGSWKSQSWTPLTGHMTSLAGVSYSNGDLELYGVNTLISGNSPNVFRLKYTSGVGWDATWVLLPNAWLSSLTAVLRSDGVVQLVGVSNTASASTGNIYQLIQNSPGLWTNTTWQPLPGYMSTIAGISYPNGDVEVYGTNLLTPRTSPNSLKLKYTHSTGWDGNWTLLPNAWLGSITAVLRTDGKVELFAVNSFGPPTFTNVYHVEQGSGGSWTGQKWLPMWGYLTNIAGVSTPNRGLEMFGLSTVVPSTNPNTFQLKYNSQNGWDRDWTLMPNAWFG